MGALIYVRNIPAVIVTMGMSFVWTGIGYTLQDSPGGQAPDWLVKMFGLRLPVPESVIVVLLLGIAAFFIYRSRYGTVLKGFGNNPAAVQRSGWSPLKAIVIGWTVACCVCRRRRDDDHRFHRRLGCQLHQVLHAP